MLASKPVMITPVSLSFTHVILLTMIIASAMRAYFTQYAKPLRVFLLTIPALSIVYAVGMLVTMLFYFSPGEVAIANSADRYLSTAAFGFLYACLNMAALLGNEERAGEQPKRASALALAGVFGVTSLFITHNADVLPKPYAADPPKYQVAGEIVNRHVGEKEGKVYVVWDEPNHSYQQWLMNYAMYPVSATVSPYIYTKKEEQTEITIFPEGFVGALESTGVTHVMLYQFDEQFKTQYADAFVSADLIIPMSLFRIEEVAGKKSLVAVTP